MHAILHRRGAWAIAWMLLLPALAQQPAGAQGREGVSTGDASAAAVRLNDIQVVGSHNSYKLPIDPALLDVMRQDRPEQALALDYAHLPLREQLDLGLRNLEIDVYHDPEGGRYAAPAGLSLAASAPYDPAGEMARPGFKVLHIQDLDFRSSCLRLTTCLQEIRDWSAANPVHVPIVITVNAKDEVIDRPGFVRPLPFDAAAFDALDAEIRSVFPDTLLLTPDDVRGAYPTLEAAVLDGQWPRLAAIRGQVLFVLDEGGARLEAYRDGHPSLQGRVLFANAPEGTPEAAVRIVNDPLADFETIQRLVRAGYLVRTRADANTHEARRGDTRRRDAAFASGAQVVTTDYYVPDTTLGTGYQVQLPGGGPARCNPVRQPASCTSDRLETIRP